MGHTPGRTTFSAVLAIGEFRALWVAELFSIAGDQLARVALAVLVFTRTNSAAATGLTYALTFVPALAGGVLLGGLGDRHPRREVMVGADLVRALLVALMAVPGIPLVILCLLVAAMTLFAGPFKAAQQALLPDVLAGEQYTVGQSIRNITSQSAQLVGFAGGGVLVSAISPSVGLLLDACTFLLSAAVLRVGVRRRSVPETGAGSGLSAYLAAVTAGARLVWRDPGLRMLIALCWLAGFYIAPEALAAPYAASLGAGAGAVGLLMASDPAGSVVGAAVFGRWVPEPRRGQVLGTLGVLAGIPLALCALRPGIAVSMVLFAVSGMLATAYTMQANVIYTVRLPPDQRAQGSGLMSSGLITVQGLGALCAGVLADLIGAVPAVALAGAAGAVVAVPIAVRWNRARTRWPHHETDDGEQPPDGARL